MARQKTVANEMPDEQRREELILGLSSTQNESVTINVSHLIQAVGLQKADELSGPITATVEAVGKQRNGPATTRQLSFKHSGMTEVDRESTLEALKEAKAKATKDKIDKSKSRLSPPVITPKDN